MLLCLQVEFCFTAEGTEEDGAILSLRGLDAPLYYRGGGVLNCGHAVVRTLVLAALRYWALYYHIDGFCFLNAETLVAGKPLCSGSLFSAAALVLSCPKSLLASWLPHHIWAQVSWCFHTATHRSSVPRLVAGVLHVLTLLCLADREGTVLDAPPLPEAIAFDPILGSRKLIARPGDETLLPRGGDRGFPHWGVWQVSGPCLIWRGSSDRPG